MTTYNVKTVLAMITVIVSVSSMGSIYGHTFSYWSSADHEYYCTASLDDISHTSNVDPCGDLTPSANRWNNVASSWDLTEATVWNSDVSSVFGSNLGQDVAGFMSPGPSTAPVPFESAYVAFNTHSSVDYGDIAVGESGTGYVDYQSTATHELGHLAGIDHNTSSFSVMYDTLTLDTVQRTPDWHDKSELGDLYP